MRLDLQEYAQQPRLADGGWGTLLEQRGLPSGMAPDLWNLENPTAIVDVARSYVHAGSEIILTNTFRTNRYALERQRTDHTVEELARAGVGLSREAAEGKAKVFASIGPTGKIVMMQEIGREEFATAYEEVARALGAAGPDAIVLETFNELEELVLALNAVKANCVLPVVACMSFAVGPDGTATIMGNSPEDLASAAREHGADAVGANCGIGPETYVTVARRLHASTDLPIWIKPNAGAPEVGPDGQTTFPIGPQEFAACVPRFLEAGASFVGGCCGTTPEHIRRMRAALDAAAGTDDRTG
jgi:methionine synthase I (cobalamin-dependent)